MNISLANIESDIIDDFVGIDEFVTIVSGDIYVNDEAFGTYCAMWLTEKTEPVNMLITPFHKIGDNRYLSPALTIGVKYNVNGQLQAVDPITLPWGDVDDGVVIGSFTKPDEYETYSLASKSFEIAKQVVKIDESIQDHIIYKY